MKIILAVFFSFLMNSCPSNQENDTINSLYKGSLTGDGIEGFLQENIVINSVNEWKEFLSKIDVHNNISNQFENSIDFSKNTVLVAIDSRRNTGGFSIEIERVVQKEGKLLVAVTSNGPKPTDMVTMALTQPIHIVNISKTDKEVVFVTKKYD